MKRNYRNALLVLTAGVLLAGTGCRRDIAPAPAPELLNSERIEQQFGSYGVRVLQQKGVLRVACLYSVEADGEVCRTVAVTLLDQPVPDELAAESAEIRAGASLGATLKAAGWDVVKRDHVLSEQQSGPEFAALLHWPAQLPPPQVAVDAYALWVERPGQSIRFARIAEAHHPDYLDFTALRDLLQQSNQSVEFVGKTNPGLVAALEKVLAPE